MVKVKGTSKAKLNAIRKVEERIEAKWMFEIEEDIRSELAIWIFDLLKEMQDHTEQELEKMPSETCGVFQVVSNGNKTDIYLNGKLIQPPEIKYGIPLTMEQCEKLMEAQENYFSALEQSLQSKEGENQSNQRR